MNPVRLILAGNASGLRKVVREMVKTSHDMKIVRETDDCPTFDDLVAAVFSHDANVLILDLGEAQILEGAEIGKRDRFDQVSAILQHAPALIVVVLESLGRRAIVHSAVHVDDVGLHTLFDTIRVATLNTAKLVGSPRSI